MILRIIKYSIFYLGFLSHTQINGENGLLKKLHFQNLFSSVKMLKEIYIVKERERKEKLFWGEKRKLKMEVERKKLKDYIKKIKKRGLLSWFCMHMHARWFRFNLECMNVQEETFGGNSRNRMKTFSCVG